VFFEAHSLAAETDFTWERKDGLAGYSLQNLVPATVTQSNRRLKDHPFLAGEVGAMLRLYGYQSGKVFLFAGEKS